MGTDQERRRGGRGTTIVREIGTERWSAATRALQAAGEEIGRVLSAAAAESMWARLLSSRVLAADDRRGRDLGLVVQHNELRWPDLLDVLDGVVPVIDDLGHPLPGCAGAPCGVCRARRALLRVQRTWEETGLEAAEIRGAARLMGGAPTRTG
jgi:hypothetical protein